LKIIFRFFNQGHTADLIHPESIRFDRSHTTDIVSKTSKEFVAIKGDAETVLRSLHLYTASELRISQKVNIVKHVLSFMFVLLVSNC